MTPPGAISTLKGFHQVFMALLGIQKMHFLQQKSPGHFFTFYLPVTILPYQGCNCFALLDRQHKVGEHLPPDLIRFKMLCEMIFFEKSLSVCPYVCLCPVPVPFPKSLKQKIWLKKVSDIFQGYHKYRIRANKGLPEIYQKQVLIFY